MTTLTHRLLVLNGRARMTREAMLDAQQLHKLVMSGFPLDPAEVSARAAHNILFTVRAGQNGNVSVLTQADLPGDFSNLDALIATRQWDVTVPESGQHAFQLTAVPTTNSSRDTDGTRIPRRPISTADDKLRWLEHQGSRFGFELVQADLRPGPMIESKVKKLRLPSTTFTGILNVLDADLFAQAARVGLGPQKAYGAGLLLCR